MTVRQVDLVLLQQGRPIVVVEVKGREIPAEYYQAVLAQLRSYSRATNSQWSVLVDPRIVRIFRADEVDQPIAEVPTRQILDDAGLGGVTIVGEAVLSLAGRRWLERLAQDARPADQWVPTAFVDALHEVDEFAPEFAVA